jgi:hypothetical protein
MVYWTAIALVILAEGYLTVSLLVAVRLSAPNRQAPERTPASVGIEYRDVNLRVRMGCPSQRGGSPAG